MRHVIPYGKLLSAQEVPLIASTQINNQNLDFTTKLSNNFKFESTREISIFYVSFHKTEYVHQKKKCVYYRYSNVLILDH